MMLRNMVTFTLWNVLPLISLKLGLADLNWEFGDVNLEKKILFLDWEYDPITAKKSMEKNPWCQIGVSVRVPAWPLSCWLHP